MGVERFASGVVLGCTYCDKWIHIFKKNSMRISQSYCSKLPKATKIKMASDESDAAAAMNQVIKCSNTSCKCPDCTCGLACTCGISMKVSCDPCNEFKGKMEDAKKKKANIANQAQARAAAAASDTRMSWRELFGQSVSASRSVFGGNFAQLATTDEEGHPRCRTVVFRGLVNIEGRQQEALRMMTDGRSEKVNNIYVLALFINVLALL